MLNISAILYTYNILYKFQLYLYLISLDWFLFCLRIELKLLKKDIRNQKEHITSTGV